MNDPRAAIANALQGFMTPEQTKILVDEVLAITKKAQGDFRCKGCGQRQYQFVEIPDAKSVSSALTDLMNQSYGRPTEASVQNDPVQFVRLTNMSELDNYKDGTKPNRGPKRNTKVNKGKVRRQPGAASRNLPAVDKPAV